MSYLQSLVVGSANETISGFLRNPDSYEHVNAALQRDMKLCQRSQLKDHTVWFSYAAFLKKLVQTFRL